MKTPFSTARAYRPHAVRAVYLFDSLPTIETGADRGSKGGGSCLQPADVQMCENRQALSHYLTLCPVRSELGLCLRHWTVIVPGFVRYVHHQPAACQHRQPDQLRIPLVVAYYHRDRHTLVADPEHLQAVTGNCPVVGRH